jgi:hypothetical protein
MYKFGGTTVEAQDHIVLDGQFLEVGLEQDVITPMDGGIILVVILEHFLLVLVQHKNK